jgi:hypothetical protein
MVTARMIEKNLFMALKKVSLPLARVRLPIFAAIRVRSLYFAPGAVVESPIRHSL